MFKPKHAICTGKGDYSGCGNPGIILTSSRLLCQKCERIRKEGKANRAKKELHINYDLLLQAQINKIIRLIDQGCKCISCDQPGAQAGHYHSTGAHPYLRFNLNNIFIQCNNCNVFKSSNKLEYDKGLIKTFDEEYWYSVKERLVKYDMTPLKLSTSDYKSLIEVCRQIIKELQNTGIKTTKERVRLRNLYNEQLFIYR